LPAEIERPPPPEDKPPPEEEVAERVTDALSGLFRPNEPPPERPSPAVIVIIELLTSTTELAAAKVACA
jgi:hypothetical protein